MAVSNPCLCWVFCMLEPRDVLVNCSGWYDPLLFTFYIIWKWQSVASPYVARFRMDISLGLPAVALAKLNTNILNLLPLTLRRIIVAEWTMVWYPSGGYWHCMHYAWGISVNCYNYYVYLLRSLSSATLLTVIILVVSSQFCDGHDTQQLCAAFALVGISRQILSNSVIYVGHDISIFLRRTWSLFSDSSLSLDVANVLRFVTLAGLDYFPDTSYTPDIAITHEFFCRIWTISYSWSLWSGL